MATVVTTWSSRATPFSVAVSVRSDQWWVFWTTFATFRTLCHQLDSNLSNLEATVKVE